MLLFDRENFRPHWRWLIGCGLALLVCVIWFILASLNSADWAGGSSFPGFTFGVVGGAIIVFECLLWVRKRYLRVWRIGRAQTWLRIHIWLGLLCLPLLILHSGFRWGGWLSTVLMLLLVFVVVSGVVGLILQQVLPRRMLQELPAETIYSQIDTLSEQLLAEADRLVSATCGTKPISQAAETAQQDESGPMVVGAVRTAGLVQGKVLGTRAPVIQVADAEPLAAFFKEHLASFLRKGGAGNSYLADARQAAVLFQNLKMQLPPEAHDVVATLDSFCEQRRQWDSQARMHFLLHSWLWIHFPFSVTLLVLMIVHVFVALKFY